MSRGSLASGMIKFAGLHASDVEGLRRRGQRQVRWRLLWWLPPSHRNKRVCPHRRVMNALPSTTRIRLCFSAKAATLAAARPTVQMRPGEGFWGEAPDQQFFPCRQKRASASAEIDEHTYRPSRLRGLSVVPRPAAVSFHAKLVVNGREDQRRDSRARSRTSMQRQWRFTRPCAVTIQSGSIRPVVTGLFIHHGRLRRFIVCVIGSNSPNTP